MSSERTIHIAAEDAEIREKLRRIIVGYGVGDVVSASEEGETGANVAGRIRPKILVLAVGPNEKVSTQEGTYREAAPDAYLIGFAFTQDQAIEFERIDLDEIVRSNIGKHGFQNTLIRADRKTAGSSDLRRQAH